MVRLPVLRLLEVCPDGRPLVECVGGVLDGRHIVLHGARIDFHGCVLIGHPGAETASRLGVRRDLEATKTAQQKADQRAEELLRSLLDPTQRQSWNRSKQFWVSTPIGRFRLGRLFDIRFRSGKHPAYEYSICVVPEGWEEQRCRPFPEADLWVNLLLTLMHDPAEFLRRSNQRDRRPLRSREVPPRSSTSPSSPARGRAWQLSLLEP